MKSQTLPIKRRPVPHGMLRRLNAVTRKGSRRQRAATTAAAHDLDHDEGGSNISWALMIVFLIHVVALCLVFIHHRFISGRPTEQAVLPAAVAPAELAAEPVPSAVVDAELSAGETPYIVRSGDTYESIAKAMDVGEGDLRAINKQVDIRAGFILKIPVKKVVVKAAPRDEAMAAATQQATHAQDRPDGDDGLVAAIDISQIPKATIVDENTAAAADGYVVKSGDTFWGIAKRHGVSTEKLMKANGIEDARKLIVGMKLKIP